MRVGVIGINHKLADLKLREALAKACQRRFGALQAVHGQHYFILLSTCNRTEVYFSSDDLALTHSYVLNNLRLDVEEEFDHKLYSYFSIDCFNHLTRVTAGLDSAIIAETEIQGQVKIAYETVADYYSLPSELHFLFQKGLNIAKKVRTDLQLGRGMPNLEHAILQVGKQIFNKPEHTRLLFVGASEINLKILNFLKFKNFQTIALCNRSKEHALKLSKSLSIKHLEWSQLDNWADYDWVILGTKSPDYLIKTVPAHYPQQMTQKLIMDLSVPRNVNPLVGQHMAIKLLNIDDLNRLLNRRFHCQKHTLNQAEPLILQATHQQMSRHREKSQLKMSHFAITA